MPHALHAFALMSGLLTAACAAYAMRRGGPVGLADHLAAWLALATVAALALAEAMVPT